MVKTITFKISWLRTLKFHIKSNAFEAYEQKLFTRKKITISHNKITHEQGYYIYLKNNTERVSIIFQDDPEIDFLEISNLKNNYINVTSNRLAKKIYNTIEKEITTANNSYR